MSLVNALARLLEPSEREAVLGDFAESGETGARAFRDLAGLVIRRQSALWRDWKPCLAAVGVVVPTALLLSMASRWIGSGVGLYLWIARNRKVIDPSLLAENGISLAHGVLVMARGVLALLAWTWSSGFVMAALSRRAIWHNGILFSCLFLLGPFYGALHDQAISVPACLDLSAVLLTLFLGMRLGCRPALHPATWAMLFVAAVVTALAAQSSFWWPMWNGGWGGGLLYAAYGPIACLAASSIGTWCRGVAR